MQKKQWNIFLSILMNMTFQTNHMCSLTKSLKKSINLLVLTILVAFGLSCKNNETKKEMEEAKEYPRWIGDIAQDSILDDKNFKICGEEKNVIQYFNFGNGPQYEGGRPKFVEDITSSFDPNIKNSFTGLVRVRFVVNCMGETGRFRLLSSGLDYQPNQIDENIKNHLIDIVKKLKGWKTQSKNGTEPARDYYQFVIFKMENGKIREVLP